MDAGLLLVLLATGVAAGVVSTLLGVGGGLLMVPLLHYGLGLPWHGATACSLLAIALQTPMAVHQHARRGAVSWRLGGLLAAGGLAGTALGWWLEARTPVPALKLLFATLMLVAAWRLWHPWVQTRWGTGSPLGVAVVGVVAGVASKLLGIGGGLVTVPILVLLGTPAHLAVGSSLVPVFTNAAVATGFNLAADVEVAWAILLGAGAIVGNPLGAQLAHALPEQRLRQVCAGALVIAAAFIAAAALA